MPPRKDRIAADLRLSPDKTERLLYGQAAANVRCAEVIASDLRAGDRDAVAQWMAPIEAALGGDTLPPLVDAWREYDQHDAGEDAVQAPLNHRDPLSITDDELEQYARAVASELYRGTRFLAALRREQRERRSRA